VVYGIGATGDLRRRGRVTRRDLLLQVADLDRHGRALERAARGRAPSGRRPARQIPIEGQEMAGPLSVRERAAAQSRATRPVPPVTSVQLALDLGDGPAEGESSGLPEMTASDRVRAELDILGLDASSHVLDFHQRFLDQLGVVRSTGLLAQRSRSQILVAGVKVATQTPPIRSGRRVIFLTLDDATGPVDATFFEDVQGPYASTVFGSWLLVVRGIVRRTGRRGISLRATGAWDLGLLADRWSTGGVDAALAEIDRVPETVAEVDPGPAAQRVLVHSSGFRMSPYADIKPAGQSPGQVTGEVARRLWHRSPGSTG
jgi:error-prone DNA polymerase